MLLMFWPGVIFIPVLLNKIFKDFKLSFLKKDYEIFIFFWFIIPLILYELIPTKLPHYIFPSYAALSILLSSVVGKSFFSEVTQKFSFFILCFYPICFLIAQIFIVNEYSNIDISLWLITFLGIFTLVMLIINFYKKDMFTEKITELKTFPVPYSLRNYREYIITNDKSIDYEEKNLI